MGEADEKMQMIRKKKEIRKRRVMASKMRTGNTLRWKFGLQ